MVRLKAVDHLQHDTKRQYSRMKERSRQRMDSVEITNDEFMNLLLDVYQYHLRETPVGDR